MWFRMAEWIKRGGALPPDRELIGELTVPTYYFQDGKFRLEEKDQIKKKLGRSPNKADALALTFAHVEMPASLRPALERMGIVMPGSDKKMKSDYDPMANFDKER